MHAGIAPSKGFQQVRRVSTGGAKYGFSSTPRIGPPGLVMGPTSTRGSGYNRENLKLRVFLLDAFSTPTNRIAEFVTNTRAFLINAANAYSQVSVTV
jgi:hypothetical protein